MNDAKSALNIEDYRDKGYLIIEGALSVQDIDKLCSEATEICLGNRGEVSGAEELKGLMALVCCKKLLPFIFHINCPVYCGICFPIQSFPIR